METSTGCISSEAATAYAAGEMSEAELSRVDEHIDECSLCRQLLSHAAQAALSDRAPEPGEAPRSSTPVSVPVPLSLGATVGRYVIDGRLGAGGMGVVYSAHDPDLHRRVALKVLHLRFPRADSSAEELLRREAMAMARLAHPNVVGIYDLFGARGTLFVAMELVEGTNLRQWLRAERRSWREVLRAFLQAGRGLVAAHAEGIVHRDFKPENVLVGAAGRICVSDFGLARMGTVRSADAAESSRRADFSVDFAGTPRYMAPEQRRGDRATARSDQFSFCVALYQSLYRAHPFESARPDELAPDWRVGPAPAGTAVPAWVRRCLLRGLSERPDDRYPSMSALLDDLTRDPSIAQRWTVVGALALIAAVAVTAGLVRARAARRAVCSHADARLGGVWDDGRKGAAAHGFEALGSPFAKDAWLRVHTALDRYADQWVRSRTQACEAVLAHAEPAAVEGDPQVACLEDRLDELRAAAGELSTVGSVGQVSKAVVAAQSLTPIDSCLQTRRSPPPRAPSTGEATRSIRASLASARTLDYFGRSAQAGAVAERAADSAAASGDDLLLAQALAQAAYSRVHSFDGDWATAEGQLYRAIVVADGAGDDATRASAWGTLLYLVGEIRAQPVEAARFFDQGMAAIRRLGGDEHIEMKLHNDFGGVLLEQRRYEEADDQFRLAAASAERIGDELALGKTLDNLAMADAARGDLDGAARHGERAQELLRQRLGETHPSVSNVLNNLAFALAQRQDFAGAVDSAQRAVAGYEASVGTERLDAAIALETLGEALLGLERFGEALPVVARSLAIRDRVHASAGRMAAPLTSLGRAYLGLRQPAEALAPLERAVATEGADPDYEADSRFALARALASLRREPERAASLAAEAQQVFDRLARLTPWQAARRAEIVAWRAAVAGRRDLNPRGSGAPALP